MKCGSKVLTLFALLGVLSSAKLHAFNVYKSGEVVHGKEYSEVTESWIDRDFTVLVGIHEREELIQFDASTNFGYAAVSVHNDTVVKRRIQEAVEKAIKWVKVARDNKADTMLGLLCVSSTNRAPCDNEEQARKKGQMSFMFESSSSGNVSHLIIDIVDMDNDFIKSRIHVPTNEMKKLLKAIIELDSSFDVARENENKKNLFK